MDASKGASATDQGSPADAALYASSSILRRLSLEMVAEIASYLSVTDLFNLRAAYTSLGALLDGPVALQAVVNDVDSELLPEVLATFESSRIRPQYHYVANAAFSERFLASRKIHPVHFTVDEAQRIVSLNRMVLWFGEAFKAEAAALLELEEVLTSNGTSPSLRFAWISSDPNHIRPLEESDKKSKQLLAASTLKLGGLALQQTIPPGFATSVERNGGVPDWISYPRLVAAWDSVGLHASVPLEGPAQLPLLTADIFDDYKHRDGIPYRRLSIAGHPVVFAEPCSRAELARFCRAFYRFEIYCNMFREPKHILSSPTIDAQREQFFDRFAPWENEQLASVMDFLLEIARPSFCFALEKAVISSPDLRQKFPIYGPNYEIFTHRILYLGLEKLHSFPSLSYDEIEEMVDLKPGEDDLLYNATRFLRQALDSCTPLGDNSVEKQMTDFDVPHEEQATIEGEYSIKAPYFDSHDPGPREAWRWAYGGFLRPGSIQTNGHRMVNLRRFGYVFWDWERTKLVDFFNKPFMNWRWLPERQRDYEIDWMPEFLFSVPHG